MVVNQRNTALIAIKKADLWGAIEELTKILLRHLDT